jgi:hypothetical protein
MLACHPIPMLALSFPPSSHRLRRRVRGRHSPPSPASLAGTWGTSEVSHGGTLHLVRAAVNSWKAGRASNLLSSCAQLGGAVLHHRLTSPSSPRVVSFSSLLAVASASCIIARIQGLDYELASPGLANGAAMPQLCAVEPAPVRGREM